MKNSSQIRYGDWPRLEVRPIIAYRGGPPAAFRHTSNANGFYSLWFVEKGSVRIQSKFGALQLKELDWILVPPLLHKRQDFSENALILSLGFEAAWTNQIPWMQFEQPVLGRASPGNALIMQAKKIVAALTIDDPLGHKPLAERKVDAAGLARIQGGLFQLLADLTPMALRHGAVIPSSHAKDSRVDQIVTDLQSQPSIHRLPYARWKKEAGLSRVQIDRLFRAEFGQTPRSQRDHFLLAAIKRHLLTRRASTKETAALFGFSDSSHLCRWFRQHASVSPEQFRIRGMG